jgi:transposase InsO family protein
MAEHLRMFSKLSSSVKSVPGWLVQFETLLELAKPGATAKDVHAAFAAYSEPEVFAALTALGYSADTNWPDGKKMILALYGSSGGSDAARARLLARRQGQDESVSQFAAAFAALVGELDGAKLKDWIGQFRISLKPSISTAMAAHKTDTWLDALDMAQAVEANEQAQARLQPAAPPSVPEPAAMQAFRPSDRGPRRSPPRAPFSGECWSCGRRGHKRSECRASKKAGLRGVDSLYVHLHTLSVGNTPQLDIVVGTNGTRVRALVDTGAQVNAVSGGLSRLLNTKVFPSTMPHLISIDGNRITPAGCITLSFKALGRTFKEDFVVVPGLRPGLVLGAHFLTSSQARVDMGTLKVSFPDQMPTVGAVGAPHPVPVLIAQIPEHAETLRTLAREFAPCFAEDNDAFGSARVEPLSFVVDGSLPIHSYPYSLSRPENDFLELTVQLWLDKGRIRPSSSPWAAPAHVVAKDGGAGMRVVIDFTRLNRLIEPDNQPAPRHRDIFDSLHGCEVFSKVDFQSAYLQIPVAEDCKRFLSFVTGSGQYEFNYVPFGLNVSGNKLQRELNQLFRGVPGLYGYADDWLIASRTVAEHVATLREVLRRTQAAGFLLKPAKCVFFSRSIHFLGRIIDRSGVHLDPEDKKTIGEWPQPKTAKELQRFLELLRWCAEFAPGAARAARPLHKLAAGKEPFVWRESHDTAFAECKAATLRALHLATPDFSHPFTLVTDASAEGFGAMLLQRNRAVRVAHKATTATEAALPATMLELAALVWAIKYFHVYLHGSRFTVWTDHKALEWLTKLKNPAGKLGLWAAELSSYSFSITHVPGPDALSRIPKMGAVGAGPPIPGLPTAQEFIDAQVADHTCSDLRRRFEAGEDRVCRGFVVDIDGVLCSSSVVRGAPVLKPFVPRPLVPRVLAAVHEHAAHLAAETVRSLKLSFHWGSLVTDAERFTRECLLCQERKSPRGPRPRPKGTVTVQRRGELVAMDLLSGIPTSTQGYSYIMVMSDYFTRYAVAVPLRTKECAEVATAFAHSWVAQFGPPAAILTDQGGEFSGSPMSSLLRRFGIQHRWTTPYHPQTDGMVERLNQTILQMLSTKLPGSKGDWPLALQDCMRAFNAAQGATNGESPYYLMFADPSPHGGATKQPAPTPQQAATILEEANRSRRRVAELNKARKREAETVNSRLPRFKVGDWVMVRDPAIRQQPYSKLQRSWIGPCRIVQVKGDSNVFVAKPFTGFNKTVHVDNVKRFHGAPPQRRTPPTQPTRAQPEAPTTTSIRSDPTLDFFPPLAEPQPDETEPQQPDSTEVDDTTSAPAIPQPTVQIPQPPHVPAPMTNAPSRSSRRPPQDQAPASPFQPRRTSNPNTELHRSVSSYGRNLKPTSRFSSD